MTTKSIVTPGPSVAVASLIEISTSGLAWPSTSILRVGSNRTVTVEIPARLVKNGVTVRLLADFVGVVDDYRSKSIFLRPGRELYWTLEDDLRYSTLWIH